MEKIVILGHHNFGLSLLIENLWAKYKNDMELNIVSNLPESENKLKSFEFGIEGLKYNAVDSHQWPDVDKAKYLNSGMSPNSRRIIFQFFAKKYGIKLEEFVDCIHPSAEIASTVKLGHGTHIGPLSCIAAHTRIGHMFFLNRSSSVGHHVQIADFVNISSGCHIGSQTKIGENVIVGMGTTIFDRVTIGKNSVIGGGSLVTKDIPEGVVAFGSPAKVVRSV